MPGIVEIVGPNHELQLFGVRLIGLDASTLRKLVLTLAFLAIVMIATALLRLLARALFHGRDDLRARFWMRQSIHLVGTVLIAVALVSIWFNDKSRLAQFAALISAGLTIALQKVITSFAGYFILLRGRVFNVGDRITMGGVRGDVISLGYIRTTIMEMGEPPDMQGKEPAVWVEARQYTGRIVSVTNDTIFDKPVFNYTREFPFVWEEIRIPIRYEDDVDRAERILLDVAGRHTQQIAEQSRPALDGVARDYPIRDASVEPRVFYRLTDNWIQLAVRFIADIRGTRELKDAMSRDILRQLKDARIPVASSIYEIVGVPKLHVDCEKNSERAG